MRSSIGNDILFCRFYCGLRIGLQKAEQNEYGRNDPGSGTLTDRRVNLLHH